MTAPRDPAALDAFDEAVRTLVEQGEGPTEIARELSEVMGARVPRARVRRSIARLRRLKAFTGATPELDAPSLESIDQQLSRAIAIGDAASAQRWARTRTNFLASRTSAGEAERDEDEPDEVEHWDRLDDWQTQVMAALCHVLHGDPLTSMDHEVIVKLRGQASTPSAECDGCSDGQHTAPHRWLCDTCHGQFLTLRRGETIAGAVGVAPLSLPPGLR